MQSISRRRFFGLAVANASLIGSTGCGTIFYPERRGQPAGMLDWKVVALDGIGLLLFFIPGVIAFAVDFNNGTIYLPPQQYGRRTLGKNEKKLVSVKFPKTRLSIQTLETIVSIHSDRDIQLTPGAYHTEELEQIDDFWKKSESLSKA